MVSPLLRPQFFAHVLGPIAHHCVALALPRAEEELDAFVKRPNNASRILKHFLETDLLTSENALEKIVNVLRLAAIESSPRVVLQTEFPLTPAQVALTKTLQKNKRNFWFKNRNGSHIVRREAPFTIEANTILRALNLVACRTEGLEIKTLEDLVSLAQRPELPTVLRPIMAGGSSFDSFIQGTPGEAAFPVFVDFCNKQRPVAFFDGSSIRINPEVLEIAREYNRSLNEIAPMRFDSQDETIFGNSAGCPVKNLRFRQHTQILDEARAGLTDEQIEILITGDNPTAVAAVKATNAPVGETESYLIMRDAVSEMLQMCGRQLESVGALLEAELAARPDNEFLLCNAALLFGSTRIAEISNQAALSGR